MSQTSGLVFRCCISGAVETNQFGLINREIQVLYDIWSVKVARCYVTPVKPATHLAILYADRGEFDRQQKSQAIFATD